MNKKKVKKAINDLPVFTVLLIGCIIAGVLLIYAIYSNVNAVTHGNNLGQRIGSLAGKAVGSFEGIIEGREQGLADGKAAGLNSDDTEARISNAIQQTNKLEVLVASAKIKNINKIGKSDVEYATLDLFRGEVVFSVDLRNASIKLKDNELTITLPPPEGELIINQSRIEKVAEYQKHFYSGKTEDGFYDRLKTYENVSKATVETLDNYEVLIEDAKESAIKQVQQLATAALLNPYRVNIVFMEDENAREGYN